MNIPFPSRARSILLALGLAFALPGAAAAVPIAYASPASIQIVLGDVPSLIIDLRLSSDVLTFGGGIDIFYDSAILQFASFEYNDGQFAPDAPLADNSAFRNLPLPGSPGQPLSVAAVFFNFSGPSGFSGDALIGKLHFDVIGIGGGVGNEIALAPSAVLGGIPNGQYLGAAIQVVPEAGALALIGSSALALLGLLRRR